LTKFNGSPSKVYFSGKEIVTEIVTYNPKLPVLSDKQLSFFSYPAGPTSATFSMLVDIKHKVY